ncbi:zinc finger protein RTS2 [Moelleriella libera RCEF 2490]|uniref:Zinc finger protein RTS2 n=1 Tax=Moelleriella libera RCEF 2490 TaxID=1081109 RepID=A0A167XE03_9HYPO|nr:zinc finger protein RTS2 [Moelleriella libera RCEF 2490]
MPRAEFGSTKHLSNNLKSKGLQRLRWYCQICGKQTRDAHGFSMHTQSESHVRQMLIVGEDPKKFINQFSDDFLKDFLQLLKTGHGEKQVHINSFYQDYIRDKNHIHMNATKWPSLTEFAKYLGREGICHVEETDKGIHISWIDNSPEALRRQEALRRKEAQDQGDEQLQHRLLKEQIRRAQVNAASRADKPEDEVDRSLKRLDGEKVTLSFGSKPKPASDEAATTPAVIHSTDLSISAPAANDKGSKIDDQKKAESTPSGIGGGIGIKLGVKPQQKNVFAQAKKNALSSGSKKTSRAEQPAKMSEAERIMREEMDRKRSRDSAGFNFNISSNKRQRS